MHTFEYSISFPKMINRQNLIFFIFCAHDSFLVTYYIKEILIEIMKLFTEINNQRRFTKVGEND